MPTAAPALESRPNSAENYSRANVADAGSLTTTGTRNIGSFFWFNPTSPWGTSLVWQRPTDVEPDQAWFWTPEWQRMEAEADEDIAAGRITRYASEDEFARAMDELLSDADL